MSQPFDVSRIRPRDDVYVPPRPNNITLDAYKLENVSTEARTDLQGNGAVNSENAYKSENVSIITRTDLHRKPNARTNSEDVSPKTRIEFRAGGNGAATTYDGETGEILSDQAEAAIALSTFEQNDIGNARRLINQFGDRLRYVVNVGWYAWDGKRWKIDEGEVAVRRFAHLTAKAIFSEVAFLADPKAQEARAKWAISSGYSPRIAGMMCQAEPHLALTADDLDIDPWLFNASNGTIDPSRFLIFFSELSGFLFVFARSTMKFHSL